MNSLSRVIVLVAFLAVAGVAQAQDFKRRFVGKNPCAPDIQSEHSDFGLRLDKTQDLSLLYRDLSTVKILMVVQSNASGDHCGAIRDVVQIMHVAKDFEFRCFDPQAPTDVIIGTSIRRGSIKPVTAIDTWRIDLKEKRFVETHDKVTCSAEGWAGEDDGGDLVNEAKKYAAHHEPGQFASEPATLAEDSQATPLVQSTIERALRKAKLIEGAQPKYPEGAIKRRISGTVELHVIIQKDGAVGQVEVVSGHPIFAQAAIDAVKQWKYPPTLSNGEPVEVDTLIFVKFSFGGVGKTNH